VRARRGTMQSVPRRFAELGDLHAGIDQAALRHRWAARRSGRRGTPGLHKLATDVTAVVRGTRGYPRRTRPSGTAPSPFVSTATGCSSPPSPSPGT
jgi:hypothetical protein